MFFVTRMTREMTIAYGKGNGTNNTIPRVAISSAYYVVNSTTGEITHGKYRKYPYSGKRDACRGAAQIFNHYMKSIEKDLLG